MNKEKIFENLWCSKGHFNKDQANKYRELSETVKPKYVVETGFCTGRSAISLLVFNDQIERMISVDINLDYMNPYGRNMASKLCQLYPNYTIIENDSKKVFNNDFFEKYYNNGIDWATIDGDHSYDGCMSDLKAVLPHMNKNGVIVIDDYYSGPPNGCHIPEVNNAVDDFYVKNSDKLFKEVWNKNGKGFCIFKIK